MLLNSTQSDASMQLSWTQLDLQPDPVVHELWRHLRLTAIAGYNAVVSAHSATLLRVDGIRDRKRGVVFEAEWPGVDRLGHVELLPCGECSRGYAMAVGGSDKKGGLHFGKIATPRAGTYTLRVFYVRNGLEDKQITLTVNGHSQIFPAIMRSWNWVNVPITLHSGENGVVLSYSRKLPFYIDKVSLQAAF